MSWFTSLVDKSVCIVAYVFLFVYFKIVIKLIGREGNLFVETNILVFNILYNSLLNSVSKNNIEVKFIA